MKNAEKVLDELKEVRPEKLTGEAKRLFETIMKIADERDELLKERQADKEKIKELESDKEIKDKMIEMYIEHIYRSCDFDNRIKTKEQIKQYFENLAKVNLQSNKENIDTRDFKQKYQCEWNLKSNKESGEIDEC